MLPSRMKSASQLARFHSPAPFSLVFASTLAPQRLLALSLEGCVVFSYVKAFVSIHLPSLVHTKTPSDSLFSTACSLFLRNTRGGVWGPSPRRSDVQTFRRSDVSTFRESTVLFSAVCALFCSEKNAMAPVFKALRTLCTKHPGGGTCATRFRLRVLVPQWQIRSIGPCFEFPISIFGAGPLCPPRPSGNPVVGPCFEFPIRFSETLYFPAGLTK